MMSRILCAIALVLVTALAPAWAQPAGAPTGVAPDPSTLTKEQIAALETPAAVSRLAATYKKQGDYEHLKWALERLAVLMPNSGDTRLALATTYALLDEKTNAYNLLLAMQKQGFGFDLSKDENFEKISHTRLWPYILQGLESNRKPFGEGKVEYTLPGGDHLYDSLAYDPERGRLLVGSVRDGTIRIVGKGGSLEDFIAPEAENGLWSVYAMAADAEADALYVASTASVYYKGFDEKHFGQAGVFKFQLSSGKLLAKYLLPSGRQPNTLSSIAAGHGMVFAADGLRNVIYRLDGDSLKPTVANPRLNSIRGLAISPDGKRLYFADYMMGLFGVDLAGGAGFDIAYDPKQLTLGGIDGVYAYENTLVVIQNGMTPRRVMRLRLAPDGRAIIGAMALDAGKPEFTLPTYGAIGGDRLYFIANSQRGAYDAYGNPKSDSKIAPVKVYASDLRFEWDESMTGPMAVPAKPPVISESRPGSGVFSNVEGGSQSVTGD